MNPRDKTLATIPALRDNAIVGTPDVATDRWQPCQEAHGPSGIVATWHRGRLLPPGYDLNFHTERERSLHCGEILRTSLDRP